MRSNDFKFYVPIDIQKANNKEGKLILEGLAGDGGKDAQGENLDYSAFDISRMFYVNWEHSKEPSDVVGVISEKKIQKGKIFLRTELFEDNPKSRDIYALAKNLEKYGQTLGYSVEGKVLERDPINSNIVRKAELYGVAICKVPVNPVTYAQIVKSMTSQNEEEIEKMDVDSVSPLLPESVEKKKKELTEEEEKSKVLSKSEIYLEIFNKFTKNISLADQTFDLINKISVMENKTGVTEETINKAMQILGLAEKSEDVIEKGNPTEMQVDGGANGGDIEVLQKAVEEAKAAYELKKSELDNLKKAKGMPVEEEHSEKITKSFDPDIMKSIIVEAQAEAFERIQKSVDVKTNALGSLIVNDREKFDATVSSLNEQLEKANSEIEKISQFNSDFRERLDIVEKTPIRKSVTTENFRERFPDEIKKSEGTGKMGTFSITTDKSRLIQAINDGYGHDLEKSENVAMLEAAATLEMTGGLEQKQITLLKAQGFDLTR